ncbi:hypothetical protein [Methylobacterium radiotolerans]|uniref:hypothetical protein n=1 Tax=Methylobacterium radiotolerans TaxID=31998 RepID=UPI0038CF9383
MALLDRFAPLARTAVRLFDGADPRIWHASWFVFTSAASPRRRLEVGVPSMW